MKKTFLKEIVVFVVVATMVLSTVAVVGDLNKGTKDSSIDCEVHVWDGVNAVWVDADTIEEAHNMPIGVEGFIRIFVSNNGDSNLHSVELGSVMNDGLVFLEADPPPDEYRYNPPEYVSIWYIGDLSVGENFQVMLKVRVDGPAGSYHYNVGSADGLDSYGEYLLDHDWVYVHPYKTSRIIKSPFLFILENHPNMFPLLQKLLQRFVL